MSNASNDEKKLLAQLNTKAAVDRTFRQLLLKDPREAIRQTAGVDVPDRFNIRFIEKPKEVDALVVLPDYIDNAAALSPEELEAVAGGAEAGDCWVVSCITSCGFTCGLITCGYTGVSEVEG